MRLEHLDGSQREWLCDRRVENWPMTTIREKFLEEFPGVDLKYTTLVAYFKSPEGAEGITSAKERVRAHLQEKQYVHRGDRIQPLVEVLVSLIERSRAPSISDRDYIAISAEMRSVIKEIRTEAEPYDDAIGAGNKSPLEDFMKIMNGMTQKEREDVFKVDIVN